MRQEDRMMAAVGCVDWELVEGAAAPAGRRRLPRRARVGLIAACLCLVLAGTVWALEAVLGVRLGQTRSGYDDSGYSVQGEFQQFDLTQFGQALQDDLARGELQWAHDSWQSAADYVGLPLLYSQLLDEAEDAPGMNARYVVDGSLSVDQERRDLEAQGQPEQIRVAFSRVVDNVDVLIYIHLYTEYADGEQLAQGVPGMAWNGPRTWYRTDGKGNCIMTGKSGVEMEFRTEGYQMANGETATIVTAQALHGAEEYIGYFVHDGVLYEVQPVALAEEINVVPDFRKLTQRILDSFV